MRKFLFLVSGMVFFTSIGFSQAKKGEISIFGNSNLTFDKYNSTSKSGNQPEVESKVTFFMFNPGIGFFVVDGFEIGVIGQLGYLKRTNEGTNYENTSTYFAIGPFLRYYVGKGKFKPFIHSDVVIGQSTNKYKSDVFPEETDKSSYFDFSFGPGAALFVNDNVALEGSLLYNYSKFTDKAEDEFENDYTTKDSGIGLKIGVSVFF